MHQRHHHVGGIFGHDAGRVRHQDAALPGGGHVDMVETRAIVGDQFQLLARCADQAGVDLVGDGRHQHIGPRMASASSSRDIRVSGSRNSTSNSSFRRVSTESGSVASRQHSGAELAWSLPRGLSKAVLGAGGGKRGGSQAPLRRVQARRTVPGAAQASAGRKGRCMRVWKMAVGVVLGAGAGPGMLLAAWPLRKDLPPPGPRLCPSLTGVQPRGQLPPRVVGCVTNLPLPRFVSPEGRRGQCPARPGADAPDRLGLHPPRHAAEDHRRIRKLAPGRGSGRRGRLGALLAAVGRAQRDRDAGHGRNPRCPRLRSAVVAQAEVGVSAHAGMPARLVPHLGSTGRRAGSQRPRFWGVAAGEVIE
jgi:hypothetical protein